MRDIVELSFGTFVDAAYNNRAVQITIEPNIPVEDVENSKSILRVAVNHYSTNLIVRLYATDSPKLNPTNFLYKVTVGNEPPRFISLPASQPKVNYRDLIALDPGDFTPVYTPHKQINEIAESVEADKAEIMQIVANAKLGSKGPDGDKGPTGDKGPGGDKGPTGDAGGKGPDGDKGPTGDKGPDGDKGPTGGTGLAKKCWATSRILGDSSASLFTIDLPAGYYTSPPIVTVSLKSTAGAHNWNTPRVGTVTKDRIQLFLNNGVDATYFIITMEG